MESPSDEAAAILAECRKQRARALAWALLYGALAVALACAFSVTLAMGSYRGPVIYLVPVLFLINLVRLGQCLAALSKIRRAEHITTQQH
jgi:hypothetical protein